MGTAEITVSVSGTSNTQFSLKYRTKGGCFSLLLGSSSTWQTIDATVPWEYTVNGTGVDVEAVKAVSR